MAQAIQAPTLLLSHSPLTYASHRSTHSYERCPFGLTSTLGTLTGIMVVTRRRGPLLRLHMQQIQMMVLHSTEEAINHNTQATSLCQQ